MPEEERGRLVVLLTLKDPLGIQVIHPTVTDKRGITTAICVMSLKRKYHLPLMVR